MFVQFFNFSVKEIIPNNYLLSICTLEVISWSHVLLRLFRSPLLRVSRQYCLIKEAKDGTICIAQLNFTVCISEQEKKPRLHKASTYFKSGIFPIQKDRLWSSLELFKSIIFFFFLNTLITRTFCVINILFMHYLHIRILIEYIHLPAISFSWYSKKNLSSAVKGIRIIDRLIHVCLH